MVLVTRADSKNIPLIRQLAEKIWRVTYQNILSAAQMEYMLQLFYSIESLQKQMDDGHQFIMAAEEIGTPVGFASYGKKFVTEPDTFRLHKIYVDPGQQGKGVGKSLLDYILNDIVRQGAKQLELNVNRNNNAVHFYQKLGFDIIREEDIDIGKGYFMNDFVMELPL